MGAHMEPVDDSPVVGSLDEVVKSQGRHGQSRTAQADRTTQRADEPSEGKGLRAASCKGCYQEEEASEWQRWSTEVVGRRLEDFGTR